MTHILYNYAEEHESTVLIRNLRIGVGIKGSQILIYVFKCWARFLEWPAHALLSPKCIIFMYTELYKFCHLYLECFYGNFHFCRNGNRCENNKVFLYLSWCLTAGNLMILCFAFRFLSCSKVLKYIQFLKILGDKIIRLQSLIMYYFSWQRKW